MRAWTVLCSVGVGIGSSRLLGKENNYNLLKRTQHNAPTHTLCILIRICFKLEHEAKPLSYGLLRENRPKPPSLTLNRNDREWTHAFSCCLRKCKRVIYGLLRV